MSEIPTWARTLVSPLDTKLGIELLALSTKTIVARMPIAGNQQPFGFLHGGATATLVETLGSLGAAAHGRSLGKIGVGVDLHVTHLRPAIDGTVTGTATAVHLGRRSATFLVEVRDDKGTLTATGSLTSHLVEAPTQQ